MTQLVVSTIGAAVGFAIGGPTGAQIGWAAGSVLGGALAPRPQITGPRLSDLKVTGVEYGQPIPWITGCVRVPGQIWWASDRREISTTTEQGKGGGPEYTEFSYEVDLLIGLTDCEIVYVSRVWLNGKLVWSARADATEDTLRASDGATQWTRMTVYTGESTQLPDPTYEAAVGAANAPAYRGRGSVFIEGLQLGNSGQIPNLTFEVVTAGNTSEYNTSILNAPLTTDESDLAPSPATASVSHPAQVSYGATGATVTAFAATTNVDLSWTASKMTMDAGYNGVDVTYEVEASFTAVGSGTGNVLRFLQYSNGPVEAAWAVRLVSGSLNVYSYAYNGGALGSTDHGAATSARYSIRWDADNANVHWQIDGVTVRTEALPRGTSDPQTVYLSAKAHGNQGASAYVFKNLRMYVGVAPFTMTVVTPSTVTLQSAVESLCTRAGLAAGQVGATSLSSITTPVRGLVISQVSPVRSALEVLSRAYFFEAVLADKLYFRPRAGSSVATIPYEDLGASTAGAGEAIEVAFANDYEVIPRMAVSYVNADADYNSDTQYSDRITSDQAATDTLDLPLVLTASEAKAIADKMVVDAWASRVRLPIALPMEYAALEPTDAVTVTDYDGRTWRLRILKRQDDGAVLKFDAVVDESTAVVSPGTTSTDYAAGVTVSALATTTIEPMDIPILRDADDAPGYYVAAKGSSTSWPGGIVYSSVDDTTFTSAATVSEAAVFGTCSTTLGNWSSGAVTDTVTTLTVDVGDGTLSSATRDALLADETVNAALVGSEIIRFQTATLSSPGIYVLSGLLRGQRGTEWACTGHAANERFVLLRSAGLRRVTTQASEIAAARYLRGVTRGGVVGDVTSESFTDTGIALKPWAPVNLRAVPFDGGATVTWDRRTRLASRFAGSAGISVPLGEASEEYTVELLDGSSVLVSTQTVTEPEATVSQYSATVELDEGVRFLGQIGADYYGVAAEGSTYAVKYMYRLNGSTGAIVQTSVSLGNEVAQVCYSGTDIYVAWSNINTSSVPTSYGTGYVQLFASTDLTTPVATYTGTASGDVQGVAHDGTDLWVSEYVTGRIRKLNDATLAVSTSHNITGGPTRMVHSSGSLFILCQSSAEVVCWNIAGSTETWRVSVGFLPYDLIVAGGNVWVACSSSIEVLDVTDGSSVTSHSISLVGWPGGSFTEVSGTVYAVRMLPAPRALMAFDATTGTQEGATPTSLMTAVAGNDGTRYFTVEGSSSTAYTGSGYESLGSLSGYTVRVAQVSATVGDGYTASITL